MKYSEGFTQLVPSTITAVAYIASALFLSLALKELPPGTAYAMWTGFGIVGTTLLGIILFHEKLTMPQVICVFFIMVLVFLLGVALGQVKLAVVEQGRSHPPVMLLRFFV